MPVHASPCPIPLHLTSSWAPLERLPKRKELQDDYDESSVWKLSLQYLFWEKCFPLLWNNIIRWAKFPVKLEFYGLVKPKGISFVVYDNWIHLLRSPLYLYLWISFVNIVGQVFILSNASMVLISRWPLVSLL